MARQRPIQIGCPNYQKLVPGTYDCADSGDYLLSGDGSFLVERAHCGHYGGRCMQTLCVLHRHNRGGPRSWFPSRIFAAPTRKASPAKDKKRRRSRPAQTPTGRKSDGLDLLA